MTAIAFCPSFVPSAKPTRPDVIHSVASQRSHAAAMLGAAPDAGESPPDDAPRPDPERRGHEHRERGAEHTVGPDAVEAAPHDGVLAGGLPCRTGEPADEHEARR